MPRPSVLTSVTMDRIQMDAITNINDLFIVLALARTGSHHKGYGPLSVADIRERLLKLGFDIPSKTIRERHLKNPRLFGGRGPEHGPNDTHMLKNPMLFGVCGPEHGPNDAHMLRVSDPKAIAQVEHLMRSLRPLVDRKLRQPPFLYRRDDWAVVATWSFDRFTTRPGTPEELAQDTAFRASAEDFV